MKLTKRGRDYLKATFILALVSSVFDIKSMLALAFALAFASLVSYLILLSITISTTKVAIEPSKSRVFKGEEFSAMISVIFKRARWVSVHLSSLEMPDGVIASSHEEKEGRVKLSVKSPYSGLFQGVKIKLELLDTLGLFSKEFRTIESKFILESLPYSVLSPVPAVRHLPLSIGDRAARSHGSSLELYALDDYQPFSDTKNLLWKKIARMPDERLIVRVREATIPRIVRVGLVESANRQAEMKLKFMDLVSEGMGTICNILLAFGCSVEILSVAPDFDGGGIERVLVSNLEEMIDPLMKILSRSADQKENKNQSEVAIRSDIVVSGLSELEDEQLAGVISKKPSLLVEEDAEPVVVGENTFVYTGVEDLRKLVSKVVER